MTKVMLRLAVVFCGQGVMAWLFYRSRVLSHPSWTDSDLVVFGLPLAVGFAVSVWVMFHVAFREMSPLRRRAAILGLATGGALMSSFTGTVIAFNLYGT